MAKHLRLLGRLPPSALTRYLAGAAIYALPARYEPFGLSILEVALSGCSLVLGDIESLREIWEDAALYVPPDDTAALAAVLARLIESPGLRKKLAARSWRRGQTLTSRRMAAAYLKGYEELLPSQPRPIITARHRERHPKVFH